MRMVKRSDDVWTWRDTVEEWTVIVVTSLVLGAMVGIGVFFLGRWLI